MKELTARLNLIKEELAQLYQRWERAGSDLESALERFSASDPGFSEPADH
jgi:hypothetical protein